MPKVLTMLEVDNLKVRNEESDAVQPLSRQECRNLIKTIESQHEIIESNEERLAINQATISGLLAIKERYFKALLNLADYVLEGDYKKETLKIIGLLDEEDS